MGGQRGEAANGGHGPRSSPLAPPLVINLNYKKSGAIYVICVNIVSLTGELI